MTLTSGSTRSGWIKAILYDQSNRQIAVSNGNASGMGGAATFPASLSAPAPTSPGTYTWKMAYFGNSANTGGTHGEVAVSTNSFSVVAATDTTIPVVTAFTLPATSFSTTIPVASFAATDNSGVTGYLVTLIPTAPSASAPGWTASPPASVTAVSAGTTTFYAWAKDAAGNVSLSRSASVTVNTAPADLTKPTLIISSLANGAYTNNATLNISGTATDADGLQSVTVNGQAVAVGTDGSFSVALPLVAGANAVTVVATDRAGNQQSEIRVVTYDPAAPILTISAPADNSRSAQSFMTLTGTINETSTVTVTDNGGSTQSASISGNNFTATVYLVPGVNTVTIAATDLAGNTTSAKRTITYDSVAMTLAVTSPSQDITTSQSSIVISGSLVDAIAPVSLAITTNGQTYTPQVTNGTFSQSLTFSQAGTYAVTVTAVDGAGTRSSITRNVIYAPVTSTSHPFGWTDPKSSHDNYVAQNGVNGCTSCHSIDLASKGQPMSCYNCHGKEWSTPSTGTPSGTSHPFGWTDPKRSHDDYVERNGVSNCTSCHSIDLASKGQPMSCYNCHGKEW